MNANWSDSSLESPLPLPLISVGRSFGYVLTNEMWGLHWMQRETFASASSFLLEAVIAFL